MLKYPHSVRVIDSHTEGEPTRVVVDGWPDLHGATMHERRADVLARFDHLRSAVVCEPRGHDAVVGALLTRPVSTDAVAGVIFFNNVGCLGMCGHGLIGVVRTLAHLGRIGAGTFAIDTPVGEVSAELDDRGQITIRNVHSYVHALDVAVDVPGLGSITGDVVYGGNWFFITHVPHPALELANLGALERVTSAIRDALRAHGVTGADSAEIDHVELYDPLEAAVARQHGAVAGARNFVMCPGGAYDRSPCGTGTSAKLAALHARGQLQPQEIYVQQSVAGGIFTAWLQYDDAAGALMPWIRGSAHVVAESTLFFDPADPLVAGFSAAR